MESGGGLLCGQADEIYYPHRRSPRDKEQWQEEAKGFGTTNNYTIIFEKVSDATGGDKKTLSWYKSSKDLASTYKATPEKLLRQEKRDDQAQDENHYERTREGHLYFFEYKACQSGCHI